MERQQFDEQRNRWAKQFDDERKREIAEWQVQFLRDLVDKRQAAYPGVFALLGAVIDVGDERGRADETPERLRAVAEELRGHLYGPAGLVMSMESRNWAHTARMAALEFLDGDGSHDDLVDAFYEARRSLRADIQIADTKGLKTALRLIGKEREAKPRRVSPAREADSPSP
jgi:hypothetical protein